MASPVHFAEVTHLLAFAPVRPACFIAVGLTCALSTSASHSADQQKVAVLEFDIQKDLRVDRIYFSDKVRGIIGENAPFLFVMTRESSEMLLKEVGKSLADCVGNCEVETGKLLGADYVISGRLVRIGHRLVLSMRLHETSDGRLLGSRESVGKDAEAVVDGAQQAVLELLRPLIRASFTTGPNKIAVESIGALPPALDSRSASVFGDLPASLLVDYDNALKADRNGEVDPAAAAQAWKRVASSSGTNPFLEAAKVRFDDWSARAQTRAMATKDADDLFAVLPLDSLTVASKEQLVHRYREKYGPDETVDQFAARKKGLQEVDRLCRTGDRAICDSYKRYSIVGDWRNWEMKCRFYTGADVIPRQFTHSAGFGSCNLDQRLFFVEWRYIKEEPSHFSVTARDPYRDGRMSFDAHVSGETLKTGHIHIAIQSQTSSDLGERSLNSVDATAAE